MQNPVKVGNDSRSRERVAVEKDQKK
jgi:NIMA (never in mitosis gene a)-related kinase